MLKAPKNIFWIMGVNCKLTATVIIAVTIPSQLPNRNMESIIPNPIMTKKANNNRLKNSVYVVSLVTKYEPEKCVMMQPTSNTIITIPTK